MAGCPSSHQPTRIREETLESGGPLQRKLNFCLHVDQLNSAEANFNVSSSLYFFQITEMLSVSIDSFTEVVTTRFLACSKNLPAVAPSGQPGGRIAFSAPKKLPVSLTVVIINS